MTLVFLTSVIAACRSLGGHAAGVATLPPCSAAATITRLQTPAPTTPSPPTATPAGVQPPTPTPGPAPQEDRVGFPEGYQEAYKLLFVFDRADNRQVRVICGNDIAAAVRPGQPLPYGSILLMETWQARLDENGQIVRDATGRFIRTVLTGVFVMRKEEGFGQAYRQQQTGEWEYVSYRPDGSYLTPPERSNSCALCHGEQSAGEEADWLFRMDLFFHRDDPLPTPAPRPNEVSIFNYLFLPETRTIPAGTTVTWHNDDEVFHTVTAVDGAFDSGTMESGARFRFTFETPGVYEYSCTIHKAIKATVVVGN